MAETYARVFPCGCFIELDIAYDWVDGQISIEEVSVKECGGLTTNAGDELTLCEKCGSPVINGTCTLLQCSSNAHP